MMRCFLCKGFFHKAIIQSGSALNPWSLAKPSPADLARAVNCPYTKDEEILNYLQDLPVDKILEGQDKLTDVCKFVNYSSMILKTLQNWLLL